MQGGHLLTQLMLPGLSTEVDNSTQASWERLRCLVKYLAWLRRGSQRGGAREGQREDQIFTESDWAGKRATSTSVDCVTLKMLRAITYMSVKGGMGMAQSSAEAGGLGGSHHGGRPHNKNAPLATAMHVREAHDASSHGRIVGGDERWRRRSV